MGLSYSYFSRSFKRVMGMSFKKYLNMIRVNRAEQMLITGDHSVSEVAIECGYNSISYFISVYRSLKGTTPFKTAMTGSPTVK
jgi:AraC-like DNA-binding protein